ncbi:MAG: SpoIIE family protein phosphatase [Clostridia bacterium]|nr:SpoIIE family protein phosphatase [Clostridia bacterium]
MDAIREKQTARLTAAIGDTLRDGGNAMQRVLCAAMMFLLSFAALPGGYYCVMTAMFAVLVRLGFCVPSAFAGAAIGYVVHFLQGNLIACWQLPASAALWLLCCLWVRREGRGRMAAAIFLSCASTAVVADVSSPLQAAALAVTAGIGAALSVLFDGAALCVSHRDELDGDTRPLCVMAVCASLTAALIHLPYGGALAMAFAAYLTIEHAGNGGGAQGVLCAGVTGGVLALSMLRAEPCVLLLCGGFLAGEVRTRSRGITAMLMLVGMAASGAAMGLERDVLAMILCAVAGVAPFVLLSAAVRAPVTGLIERFSEPEISQSEAIAVRCASMIHAWSQLYDDTANMMQGLITHQQPQAMARQCVELLRVTSMAAHQVCERTLSQIRPDDEAFRAIRYALVRAGLDDVRVAYALQNGGRMEVLLLKGEAVAPASLTPLVSRACGRAMRPGTREGLLSTQALFEQTPPLMLEIGAALRSRSGEEVAGDGYASRALPGGRHMLALSDGMGSGENAMQQSHAALTLMVESLKAGYTRPQALELVNALMLMCTGREMFATMDLCVVDLHTGEAAFEKLGACASYVVRSGEVRAIGADTLPVGMLDHVDVRSLRMTLEPGDVVVMLSDGVFLGFPGGEDALCKVIEGLAWLHPQAIGERLIAQAIDGGEAADDMAVLCARIGKTLVQ